MLAHNRLDALDVLRGFALAAMLLVNNPGSWSHVYSPLLHAPWHGLTPTDWIFPLFLFVVGAAMAYSFTSQIQQQSFNWLKIIKRSVLLILLGIILSAFPYQAPITEWRLPGVLQRIGLCYLLVAIAIRFLKPKLLIILCILSLLGYWFILSIYSHAPYSLEYNLVRQLDLRVLGASHLWHGLGLKFDPEGLLSTLPASITCLSGYLITQYIRKFELWQEKLIRLITIGIACIGLAKLIAPVHPINKSLWTSSYVLITTGIACLILAGIIFLWDKCHIRIGLHALRVYGSNPILLFVLAGLVARIMNLISLNYRGTDISLKQFLYLQLSTVFPAKFASLMFAILFALVFYWLARCLYARGIFVKI